MLSVKERHFKVILTGTVSAAGTVTIPHRYAGNGEVIVYDRIVIENTTTANAEFLIQVKNSGTVYKIVQFNNVAVNQPQTYDTKEIEVIDDDILEIFVFGAASGDAISCYLFFTVKPDYR